MSSCFEDKCSFNILVCYQWHQANPHQFHLLTLGTLHALPTPVQRRGQKMNKPEFFEVGKRAQEAGEAVEDIRTWLRVGGMRSSLSGAAELANRWGGDNGGRDAIEAAGEMMLCSSWTKEEVVRDTGAILRARDHAGTRLSTYILSY